MQNSFRGKRRDVIGEATWALHTVRIVNYAFEDEERGEVLVPYLEVTEEHTGIYQGARILALDTVVHALLNLGEMEVFEVGNRAKDYAGKDTGNAQAR